MKTLTAEEMQKLDKWAIEEIGLPRICLMEMAGYRVAESILREYKNARSIAIFCYKGNNGGDGLVTARYLFNANRRVEVFLLCPEEEIKNEPKINLEILKKLKIPIFQYTDQDLSSYDLIVDAIFGISFEGKAEGLIKSTIENINQSKKVVVSVDVPSGIDPTTGKVEGSAIKADLTVTFQYAKTGLLKLPASRYLGRLIIADIGIPKGSPISPSQPIPEIIHDEFVASRLQKRPFDAHKGVWGEVLLIAGSETMLGAAILSGKAALRTGAGMVKLAISKDLFWRVNKVMPEIITLPRTLRLNLNQADVMAIGPGIEVTSFTKKLVKRVIEKSNKPLVIDADGLNSLAGNLSYLKKKKAEIIITPHPGEMARLLKTTAQKIQKNREGIAKKVAQDYGIIVVLKGARTVIANKEGGVWINPTGNPGMASAGVGDVLTGMIASLIGQGLSPFDAARVGVYLHGKAGDLAAQEKGSPGIIASDLIERIPQVLASLS